MCEPVSAVMRTGLRQRICIGLRKRIPGGGDRRATLAHDARRRRPKDRVQEGLTFQPPDISRSFLTVREVWKNGDCLVDDAVAGEPVSLLNSLLTGKITGKFAKNGRNPPVLPAVGAANSMACG